MSATVAVHAGLRSDPGRQRTANEDRVFADDARGIYLVVDGLGGHAAGEIAAEAAVQTIAGQLRAAPLGSDPEAAIRNAITAANNHIFELTESHPEWRGMACVLTLTLVQDDKLTVGHVGDSRLYLAWNGHLKKLTCDHSPVGEQEDAGVLTEAEAMNHPRRNEVFREVGSRPRSASDPQFIEVKQFDFRPDAALLLCSDGLSDLLTSTEINAVIERYDGDPELTAQQLINAANKAGGKDNISVVFVPGPGFLGGRSKTLAEARSRHSITRSRDEEARGQARRRNALFFFLGLVLGLAMAVALRYRPVALPPAQLRAPLVVDSADPHGIQKALAAARPGDTIQVPPGDYFGPLELKSNVNLVSQVPSRVKLHCDPNNATDNGLAVVARSVQSARVEGVAIIGDEKHPLRTGVSLAGSSLQLVDLDISGAIQSGVEIEGVSQPLLVGNFIHANAGAGVAVGPRAAPLLTANWIVGNGTVPGALHSGIEIASQAEPRLTRNVIAQNGLPDRLHQDSAAEIK